MAWTREAQRMQIGVIGRGQQRRQHLSEANEGGTPLRGVRCRRETAWALAKDGARAAGLLANVVRALEDGLSEFWLMWPAGRVTRRLRKSAGCYARGLLRARGV